ncbi:N-acetyltransferase [Actinoplanes sp. NPDC049265]|uniref:N-acetyltransferase n=1 Tax=Actinoplanes sp. NPDC049265 TaxID=3363902 RepID=UPI003714FB6E
MDLDITSPAEDPARWDVWDELDGFWPEFMTQDPTSGFYYGYLRTHFAAHCLVAVDRSTGRAVAKAHSVPLSYDLGADPLPDGGWDWAVRRSVHDRLTGTEPTIASALEIMIRPDLRGAGLSAVMLGAMRANVAELGFRDLIAPVRPTGRSGPIREYAHRTRPDGLPVDPWLRVHVRAGGRIVNVAHTSMVMTGRLAQWRGWTGLPFDTDGPVDVPSALAPVQVSLADDVAVYVEPNVWVHHRL